MTLEEAVALLADGYDATDLRHLRAYRVCRAAALTKRALKTPKNERRLRLAIKALATAEGRPEHGYAITRTVETPAMEHIARQTVRLRAEISRGAQIRVTTDAAARWHAATGLVAAGEAEIVRRGEKGCVGRQGAAALRRRRSYVVIRAVERI